MIGFDPITWPGLLISACPLELSATAASRAAEKMNAVPFISYSIAGLTDAILWAL